MRTFREMLDVGDSRERLAAMLERLDRLVADASKRMRWSGSSPYPDPDTTAILKAEQLATQLLSDYHARTLTSVESIGTLDRAAAIAELEAVLAVWKDPSVTDAAWRAARTGALEAPVPVKRGRGRPPKGS
jgi:hypothetical protein